MTLEEMRELLAVVASFDGRTVDALVITEWHATALGALPADLARAAVRSWYSENAGYIQPHHIVTVAARLAGVDRPDSVTERRLTGRALPFGGEPLAPPLHFEIKEITHD